jgi:hypothetical protein
MNPTEAGTDKYSPERESENKMDNNKETCTLKHLGGLCVPSCLSWAILDYDYYYKDSRDHAAILTLYRRFKYCPFCGKPIVLPWWMVDDAVWKERYGKLPTGRKTREELIAEMDAGIELNPMIIRSEPITAKPQKLKTDWSLEKS